MAHRGAVAGAHLTSSSKSDIVLAGTAGAGVFIRAFKRVYFMRLPLIPPEQLTPEQKPLYADMKAGIASNFNAFKTIADDGSLVGPWNAWLHEPVIGRAVWELTKAMTAQASLSDPVRQVAILVVGAHFDAAYELYAHIAVAEKEGMSPSRLSTLVSGSRPSDLSEEEACAYDVAFALTGGGVLPERVTRARFSCSASMAPMS